MKKRENVSELERIQFFRALQESLDRDERIKKEIFSNYDYISWLEKFTLTNEFFRLDELIYYKKKMPKEDWDNAEKIGLFFDGVEEYATEKGIKPEDCGAGPVYGVKHNGIRYYIGFMEGQGTTNFCSRTNNEDSVFIDFSDIVNYEKGNDKKDNKTMEFKRFIPTKLKRSI